LKVAPGVERGRKTRHAVFPLSTMTDSVSRVKAHGEEVRE
jgi:hypothetical protein